MKNLILSLVAVFMFTFSVQAQQHNACGMTPESIDLLVKRLKKNKAWLKDNKIEKTGAITYVPIKFHLLADSDGEGRVNETGVLAMLCRLNDSYADQEIQFFIYDGFNYIDNTGAYTGPSSFAGELKLQGEKVNGAVNIFICQNANSGNPNSVGVTLGYYTPTNDWIILRRQEASYGSATLPHEMGHLLSLPHPFNGWDFEPYDASVHSNPVQGTSPLGVTTENSARSGSCKNCDEAGDFICDTPPSYLHQGGCSFNANIQDPCGESIAPMINNYMDYFENCTDYEFTPDQQDLIAADLQDRFSTNSSFGSINTNYQPNNTAVIEGSTTLEVPANNEELPYYNVLCDWSEVANADTYILEIDRFPSFSVDKQTFLITDGSSRKEFTDELNPNTTYYWRVTPYNETSTCASTTPPFSFTTGDLVATNEIDVVNAWSVQPNPVKNTSEITIKLDTRESFEANINLYDITGKLVKSIQQHQFSNGNNTYALNIDDINNGMYVLAVSNKNGVLNTKLVVAK